jgi:hypothetical protein
LLFLLAVPLTIAIRFLLLAQGATRTHATARTHPLARRYLGQRDAALGRALRWRRQGR